ncbi:MAG: PH domain-containing protein [Minisyncoccia bacterium]
MDTSQKLGIKVFYYYLSKRVSIGAVLLIGSFFFSFFQNSIGSVLAPVLGEKAASAILYDLDGILFFVSILFIAGAFLISWLDYISCTFALDEDSFVIRRGILNKKEISIPYRQIQDIDIEQSFYHKIIGVSRLVILTAGNDEKDKEKESEGTFWVIDATLAERLRGDLLQKTSVQKVDEVKS